MLQRALPLLGLTMFGLASLTSASMAAPQVTAMHAAGDELWETWASLYLFNTIFLEEYTVLAARSADASVDAAAFAEKLPPLRTRALVALDTAAQLGQSIPAAAAARARLGASAGREPFAALLAGLSASFSTEEATLAATLAALYGKTPKLKNPCSGSQAVQRPAACSLSPASRAQPGELTPLPALALLTPPERTFVLLHSAAAALHGRHYPPVLAFLMHLQSEKPIFRLAYERVQRLYSLNEKGSGRVALQAP